MASVEGPNPNRVGQNHDQRHVSSEKKGIKKASFLDIITLRGKKITLDGEKVWVNKASLAKFVLNNLPPSQSGNTSVSFFEHIFVTDKTLKGLKDIEKSDEEATEIGLLEEPGLDSRTDALAQRVLQRPSSGDEEDLSTIDDSKESLTLITKYFDPDEIHKLTLLGETIATIAQAIRRDGQSGVQRLRKKIERETDQVRERDQEARDAAKAASQDQAFEEERKRLEQKRLESTLATSALAFSGERNSSGHAFPEYREFQSALNLYKTATQPASNVQEVYRQDFVEKAQVLAKKKLDDNEIDDENLEVLDLRDALTATLNYYVKEFYSLSVNSFDWREETKSSRMLEIKIDQFKKTVLPFADLLQINGRATLMAELPQLSKMASEFFHEFYAFNRFNYSQVKIRTFMETHFQAQP